MLPLRKSKSTVWYSSAESEKSHGKVDVKLGCFLFLAALSLFILFGVSMTVYVEEYKVTGKKYFITSNHTWHMGRSGGPIQVSYFESTVIQKYAPFLWALWYEKCPRSFCFGGTPCYTASGTLGLEWLSILDLHVSKQLFRVSTYLVNSFQFLIQ